MRANDCIEIMNYAGQFHKELKRAIYEFNYYRNDQSGTESLYNLYLVQDKTRKMYLNDLNDWELNNLDKSSKPFYIENDLGITYDLASHFRDLLFNAIENDKSYGYLFYLLASEKNRIDPFYQRNPIDVFVNIVGKQKRLAENADKLTNIAREVMRNPQAIAQIPSCLS